LALALVALVALVALLLLVVVVVLVVVLVTLRAGGLGGGAGERAGRSWALELLHYALLPTGSRTDIKGVRVARTNPTECRRCASTKAA
jgi:hypothetical protein